MDRKKKKPADFVEVIGERKIDKAFKVMRKILDELCARTAKQHRAEAFCKTEIKEGDGDKKHHEGRESGQEFEQNVDKL